MIRGVTLAAALMSVAAGCSSGSPHPAADTARSSSASSSASPTVTTSTTTATTAKPTVKPNVKTYQGTLLDGAQYKVRVPAPWNGTLGLFSHGYVAPGGTNVAADSPDAVTGDWLLAHHYALAGSSYASTGWAIDDALKDQTALLGVFDQLVGRHPNRTIAWGDSMGGLVTAGLIQMHPESYAGALPMCGIVGGSVAFWNEFLDSEFALKQLVAPAGPLELVNITNPSANVAEAEQLLDTAQQTPRGRARLALSAALGQIPGWFDSTRPEPHARDVAGQELHQYQWLKTIAMLPYSFRAEIEQRAHGNVSWNSGIDYRHQLAETPNRAEVATLYAQAGLNLDTDLDTLNAAPRVAPNPFAIAYLRDNLALNGDFGRVPVLTLHTTGDGLVVASNEQAYAASVARNGRPEMLRQVWVNRAGHCVFTSAETIAAFETLVHRLDTGKWSADPATLENRAKQLSSASNLSGDRPTKPAFAPFKPAPLLRPFDASSVMPR